MIDYLLDSETPTIDTPNPFSFDLTALDDSKKHKHKRKGQKHRGKNKSAKNKHANRAYAKLAFHYGVLSARYDMLERMTELAIAANRNRLNGQMLDNGLAALGKPRK